MISNRDTLISFEESARLAGLTTNQLEYRVQTLSGPTVYNKLHGRRRMFDPEEVKAWRERHGH